MRVPKASAAGHLQVVLGSVEVGLHSGDVAIDGLQIVGAGLGVECRLDGVDVATHFRDLLLLVVAGLCGFVAGRLQVALRHAQALGHHAEIAFQLRVSRVGLRLLLLQRRNLLSVFLLRRLDLAGHVRLQVLHPNRVVPGKPYSGDSDNSQNDHRRHHPTRHSTLFHPNILILCHVRLLSPKGICLSP